MIAEYLQRDFVLSEMETQLDSLREISAALIADDSAARKAAEAELTKHGVSVGQLADAIAALEKVISVEKAETPPGDAQAFIPSNPLICLHQAEWTKLFMENSATDTRASSAPAGRAAAALHAPFDTSAPHRIQLPPAGVKGIRRLTVGGFKEGGLLDKKADIRYGLDGFFAKFGGLFRKKRPFNTSAAKVCTGDKPLRLFLFGDWGTGLPLAAKVTSSIRHKLAAGDGSHRQHVIHLGDVYYTGRPDEYKEHVLSQHLWPVAGDDADTGSWCLNGNHDMYSGGHGYFDTLLASAPFKRWHADAQGNPSSFFLIEDPHWQVFGLDTSWNIPPLRQTILSSPTKEDYAGQNGILTPEQIAWMQKVRDPNRGCIMLTHHQPASSRTTEHQHSDSAIADLHIARLYRGIDAWIWGHEHRAVVFRSKAGRTDDRLRSAPEFCCCLGHGGVPVDVKHFNAAARKPDVAWEEDRIGNNSPVYEGSPIMPFGFGCLETRPDGFKFVIFDHNGQTRHSVNFQKTPQ